MISKRAIARLPSPLTLIGWANLLFLAVFLLTLAVATRQAAAQDAPSCTGNDLVAALRAEDPAALAEIEKKAAEVPNGASLLWTIEKPGVAPSHLLGTMHLADPRVVNLPADAQAAFDAASTVVIETTDVLDQSKMMAAMAERPDLMMFTDATTLSSLLTPEQRVQIEAALKERGISLASVDKMKPWMLATMVATPACELARKTRGEPVLDQKIALDAKAAGKRLDGLETAMDQLGAMASLPMEFHLASLVETLALGDKVNDVIETMIVLYLDHEIAMLWPLLEHVLPGGSEGYSEFEQVMITARNHTMAERAVPILDQGSAFIAVGALHLPGPEGVVELLRKEGYTLTAVK